MSDMPSEFVQNTFIDVGWVFFYSFLPMLHVVTCFLYGFVRKEKKNSRVTQRKRGVQFYHHTSQQLHNTIIARRRSIGEFKMQDAT